MFRNALIAGAVIAILTPTPLWCGDDEARGVPVVREVTPATVSAGVTVIATGEFLDRLHAAEVYMTRGTEDTKVQVVAQSRNELKFKVPGNLEAGRYGLTILTAGKVPMLLDQPVWLLVKTELPTSAVPVRVSTASAPTQ